uniref:HMG box domain-containing protein n=1 Tax=Syphacia muris TaxID=451379 RepID=A0A0N5ASI6_9BILA
MAATDERKRHYSFGADDKGELKEQPSNKKKNVGSDEAEDDVTHLSLQQMTKIIEDIKKYTDQSSANANRKFSTFNGFDCLQLPDNIDIEVLKGDLRRYFKEATLLSSVSLKSAANVIFDFLKQDRSLMLDPNFPKKPATAYMIFQKNMISLHNYDFFDSTTKTAAHWKDKEYAKERLAAEVEAKQLLKEYADQLLQYRDSTPNLSTEHLSYINKQIKTALKTCNPEEKGEKKTSTVKVKKEKPNKKAKTAFDLYDDLSPERKEKKLRKKFSKLSEEELSKFENLSRVL